MQQREPSPTTTTQVITNNMRGYLPMRIVQFLSNIHTKSHSIYISRHGQSEYNMLGKLGGNPPLTSYGNEYATRLARFAEDVICKEVRHGLDPPLCV